MTHRRQWLLVFTLVAAASCARAQQAPRVLPGIDVLMGDSVQLITGRRIGLITNQTGVDARGISSVDRLYSTRIDARFNSRTQPLLVSLFAPEHHFSSALRPGQTFGDTVDAATGLPIYSLYGERRAPTAAQLAALDVLIVDLQDVGARPFTYISTTILAMRAVRAAGKRIVVLDRPNPIGCVVEGPVLDSAHASFIGMLPVPLRHGMTIGELARFANAELRIGADLTVVPVQGWRRCDWFDQTGLPWVRPSPNLPDLESAAWYPGTVLFEATNLSVGRGTDAPFRQVGAPWLVPQRVVTDSVLYPGLLAPVTFTPREPGDGKYPGVPVAGYRWLPALSRQAHVVREALTLMVAIAVRQRDSLQVDSAGLARRLGVPFDPFHPPVNRDGSLQGDFGWRPAVDSFRVRVRPYLLYQ